MIMRTLSEVVLLVRRVDQSELSAWVERGWVIPRREAAELAFSELDIARIELIADLRYDLAVEEETLPLVLRLLDQIHGLRHQVQKLTAAIKDQPEDIRTAILKRLEP